MAGSKKSPTKRSKKSARPRRSRVVRVEDRPRRAKRVAAREARTSERRSDPRGRRFSTEQHQHALTLIVSGMKREEVAASVGCTTESLRRWWKMAHADGTLPTVPTAPGSTKKTAKAHRRAAAPTGAPAANAAPAAVPGAPAATSSDEEASSSAPKDPGNGLSEGEIAAILDWKRKHASMGPAQIRAQLKRFKGWRISIRAIANVLRKNGYELVHRGARPDGETEPTRFEAPYRNALWQVDFKEFRIGSEVRHLLVFEDDFSRFVVGHSLSEAPTTEVATATLREAIALHGKPEKIYSDRGAAFTAWSDITAFEVFLDGELIDHSLRRAHHPRGGGKVESLVGTVERELWHTTHFESVAEAERGVVRFLDDYNHRRAHLGIGGLCPADRFFGRWREVAAEIDAVSRRRQGALAFGQDARIFHEPPLAADRVLVLELVFVGDVAELRFCGRRVRLGRVEG